MVYETHLLAFSSAADIVRRANGGEDDRSNPVISPEAALSIQLASEGTIAEEEKKANALEKLAEMFFVEGNLDMAKTYLSKVIAIRDRVQERKGIGANPSTSLFGDLPGPMSDKYAAEGKAQYLATLSELRTGGYVAKSESGGEPGLRVSPQASPHGSVTTPKKLSPVSRAEQLLSGDVDPNPSDPNPNPDGKIDDEDDGLTPTARAKSLLERVEKEQQATKAGPGHSKEVCYYVSPLSLSLSLSLSICLSTFLFPSFLWLFVYSSLSNNLTVPFLTAPLSLSPPFLLHRRPSPVDCLVFSLSPF